MLTKQAYANLYHHLLRWLLLASLIALLTPSLSPPRIAAAAPWANNRTNFASPRFQQVWNAADQAVATGASNRSWIWGPQPWFDYHEFYKPSPNGLRLVQYFDKARMELNDPSITTGPLAGVTNGLLVVEMVSGRVKLGDGTGPDQNQQRYPAFNSPVAGDLRMLPDTVVYGDFRNVATIDNGYRDQNKVGQRVGTTFSHNGSLGSNAALATSETQITTYEQITGHNVPRVFDDFRNAGPLPAIVTFGYPITDAYWIKAVVAGQPQDVLIQLFERRTLTYTPANPKAFQVEMGNVGQHYFSWRYPSLGMPWAFPDPVAPIAFASKQPGPHFNVYTMDASGNNQQAVTQSPQDILPFSLGRAWSSPHLSMFTLFGDSTRFTGKRQLVTIDPNVNALLPERLSQIAPSTANDYNAAVSPDGTKLAFASDRDGNPELYLISLPGTGVATRLTDTTGCTNEYPSWLPDGTGLVYESNCQSGNFELYRGSLSYKEDQTDEITLAQLISPASPGVVRLTNNSSDDRYPRVSPDGTQIAWTATRDGNEEIYLMNIDGSYQHQLAGASNPASDEAPTWSQDGLHLAWGSNRTGTFEIFSVDIRAAGQATQLTTNSQDNQWPIWAQ